MSKLVILHLGEGNFDRGFPVVTLRIADEGKSPSTEVFAKLPPAPQIPEYYQRWQRDFRARIRARIKAISAHTFTANSLHQLSQDLKISINSWLSSAPFQPIRETLLKSLNPDEEVRFIIQSSDMQLRRLPWHLWNFFESYPQAEIGLGSLNYTKVIANKSGDRPIKILGILGDDTRIDIEKDRRILDQLPQTQIEWLVKPKRRAIHDHLWQQPWDILFFAGHSCTEGERGRIYINPTESLTISELKNALKRAITGGDRPLQLAIFNSCDGLGLAQELADLQIPLIIVMREPVPDEVAQTFIKYFLECFSTGKSLYLAVREARERLQGLEDRFPCASWLPVLCQNPAVVPINWQQLRDGCPRKPKISLIKKLVQTSLIASFTITSLVLGLRSLGFLEAWELNSYDQLINWRSPEHLDPRLLLITITEKDIQSQDPQQRKGSLSDAALAQLLEQLEAHQPRVIGLDIYRDFPVASNYPTLATNLRQNPNFFAICQVGQTSKNTSIAPPPEIPETRQGFSDVLVDPDGKIRRHLLGMAGNDDCDTSYSFSLQVALHYLAKEGIKYQRLPRQDLQIGDIVFQQLKDRRAGGYQKVDLRGYQLLLNYRDRQKVARTATLEEILSGQVDPDWIKDKIVLIGTTAQSVVDEFYTPYSGHWQIQEMPGLIIQAQMVSQILSAVLDNRLLLWVWPAWAEAIWVGSWSLIGSLVVGILSIGKRRSPLFLGLAIIAILALLYGSCFIILLTWGGWIPLVPSILASSSSCIIVAISIKFQEKQGA